MERPIYLSAIESELGCARPLTELAELGGDESNRELLEIGGLCLYLETEIGALELAERAIAKTLTASRVPAAEIGLLVYASESGTASPPVSNELGALCHRLGLEHAYPLGLWGSACSNLVPALNVASRALAAGRARHVIVAVSDVVYPHESRLLPPALTLFSDGAASCLVSVDQPGALSLRATAQFSDSELWSGATLDRVKQLSLGIQQVCQKVLAEVRKPPRGCAKLVMNHYTHSVQRLMALSGGFRREQIFRELVASHAHVGTADTLLGLHALLERGAVSAKDVICLLSTGPSLCGAAALEVQ